MKAFGLWLAAASLLLAAAGAAAEEPSNLSLAVALPRESDYWLRFQRALRAQAAAQGVEVKTAFADSSQMKQNAQVDRFLASSPKVLILAAHDALGAAAAVKKTRAAGVRALSLDRLTLNADLDFYLAYDHEKAGEAQAERLVALAPRGFYIILSGPPNDYSYYLAFSGAMKILEPLAKAGLIRLSVETPVIDGDGELARARVLAALARAPGGRPAAVLAPDDEAAEGALAALKEAGLDKKTILAGQNGGLAAAERIRNGEEAMTVFKDPAALAAEALALALLLARGEDPAALGSSYIDNGFKKIPALLLPPTPVDRRNLDLELVRAGFPPSSGGEAGRGPADGRHSPF